MSTGRSNALDALPRASLLTYFRRPQPRPLEQRRTSRHYERPPPPYTHTTTTTRSPLLPRIPEAEREDAEAELDEEAQFGFWGERSSASKDGGCYNDDCEGEREKRKGCRWGFYEILSLVCYALLVLVLVLNLDAFLSRLGVGTGVVDWNGYSVASNGSREMQFCLVSADREAPTSRVWRFMAPTSLDECTTQIVTLGADAAEGWKLLPDDKILVGEDEESKDGKQSDAKFISVRHAKRKDDEDSHDVGDDLAEEGDLISGRQKA